MRHFTFHNNKNLTSWDVIFELIYVGHQNTLEDRQGETLLNYASNDNEKFDNHDYHSSIINLPFLYEQNLSEYNSKVSDYCNSIISNINLQRIREFKKDNDEIFTTSIYLSFNSNSKSHGIHRDTLDVFHWQQQGLTQFTIFEEGKHVYLLEPGDCIFIPRGMYHDTLPITPRAGISIGFISKDYDFTKESTEEFYDRKGYDYVYSFDNPFAPDYNHKEINQEVNKQLLNDNMIDMLIKQMKEDMTRKTTP